jgi:peptidoglycan/LPS O-acetylase OafA/YrhL
MPAASGPRWPLIDLAAALVVFPMVVAFAARAPVGNVTRPLANFLGAASYPLYALRFPALIVTAPLIRPLDPLSAAAAWCAVVVGLIVSAWMLDRWLDQPIRRWLMPRSAGNRNGRAETAHST